MTRARLVVANLSHHAGRHLVTALAIAVATAVVTGALIVGDSVRAAIEQRARDRLGAVKLALDAGSRPFRADLADRITTAIGERADESPVEAVIRVAGVARDPVRGIAAGGVSVYGVGESFYPLMRSVKHLPPPGTCDVGWRLAEKLHVKPDDEIVLRVDRPGALPGEASMTRADAPPAMLRLKVSGVLGRDALGDFALDSNGAGPWNVFVRREVLAGAIGWAGRANLLLSVRADEAQARQALARQWTLDDVGVRASPIATGVAQLESRGVFLPEVVGRAALLIDPQPGGVLAWLADELRVGERSVPYAIVAGVSPGEQGGLPAVRAGTIALNDWCANELQAKAGDRLTLRYRGVDRTATTSPVGLVVAGVLPMARLDPRLMPELPGISDAATCRDWDSGLSIDLEKIRPQDEAYWKTYRGTPKALIALSDAQRLFGSRFGDLTALRYERTRMAADLAWIRTRVDPAMLGLAWRPVAREAEAGTTGAMDFGGLFLGLSFFLIAAALALAGLVFGLHVDARAGEWSTLAALGFPRAAVRRLALEEAAAVAVPAVIAGVGLGVVYAGWLVELLGGMWSGALAGWAITRVVRGPTLAGAATVTFAVVGLVLRFMLAERRAKGGWVGRASGMAARAGASSLGIALAFPLLRAMGLVSASVAALCSGAGVLVAGVLFAWGALAHEGAGRRALAWRGAARRAGRSAAVIGMVAAAVFLVVVLESQKLDPAADRSATGGFDLVVELTRPLNADPSTAEGCQALGIDAPAIGLSRIVPVRVLDGDDASCLNLAHAQVPRVLGVDPLAMERSAKFRFASGRTWLSLRPARGAIPAAVDGDTLEYGLGRGEGDTFTYRAEAGQPVTLQVAQTLAPSLLQGALIVDQAVLAEAWPSRAGIRMLLVNATRPHAGPELERALADHGAVVQPAAVYFARFARVQNTYIAIFQVLGVLGLLLGSAGMAVTLAASALERRGELALMRAVGWSRPALRRLLAREHAGLFAAGVSIGAVSALAAIAPRLTSPARTPWDALGLMAAGLIASGWMWCVLAARRALAGDILAGLRRE